MSKCGRDYRVRLVMNAAAVGYQPDPSAKAYFALTTHGCPSELVAVARAQESLSTLLQPGRWIISQVTVEDMGESKGIVYAGRPKPGTFFEVWP